VRKGRLISLALAVGFLAGSLPVFAHHGKVEYESKAVTMKGTVTKFEWINPHCILGVAVKNEKDIVEDWYAEILPPNRMAQAGWTQEIIKPGDEVTVVGRPGKKGAHIMWLEYVVLSDGRKLRRDANAR
jgi:hypothetical protein